MDLKSRILSSSAYRLLGNLVRIFITLLITPFLISTLGNEQYGLWLLIVAAVGWFQVMDFGFSSAVQRNIAIALERNDKHSINVAFSCAVALFTLLGVVAGLAFTILSIFPSLLGISEAYADVSSTVILIFALKVFWDMVMNIYHGFYAGLIRYDIDANINTLNETSKAIAVFVLVSEFQILGAVLATMLADVISNGIKVWYVRKLCPAIAFSPSLVTAKEIRNLFNYSKHVVALDIANILDIRLYALVVSHVAGLASIAVFGVAQRLVVLIEQLYLSTLGVFLPVFTRLSTRNADMDRVLQLVVSLNTFLVSICFVPLIVLDSQFVTLWLGPGFEEVEYLVFAISLAFSCKAISRPIGEMLLAQANHSLLARLRLLSIAITVSLAVIFGSRYGLYGVAGATLAGGLCGDVVIHLLLYRHYQGKKAGTLAVYFLRMLILIVTLTSIGSWLFNDLDQLSWLELILSGGLVTIVTFAAAWLVTLNEEVRQKLLAMLERKLDSK